MGKKYEFKAENTESVAALLAVSVPSLSRAKSDILVKSGEVRVNGARIKNNITLNIGDTVSVFVPDSLVVHKNIDVVYEDENIVVFDKPKHTPFDAVPSIVAKALIPVHRLDTNTTGVIVFAKTESVAEKLIAAFKARDTEKRYEAVVSPVPKKVSGILTAYVSVENKTASVSQMPRAGYKTMITEYKVTERINDAAVVEVLPYTGRMHQIRAHFAFIGCPIVGDDKYGGKPARGADGQLLRAVSIRFNGLDGDTEYLNGKTFSVQPRYDSDFLRSLRFLK